MRAFITSAIYLAALASADTHRHPQPILQKRVDQVTVVTPIGTIVGAVAGVEAFNGIPFAEPPLKSLRLRPPVRLTHHLGHFDATAPAPACPQGPKSNNTLPGLPPKPEGQEDCLTVTVQRPIGTSANASLPVLFYIYGGGFEDGSTSMYNATTIMNIATNNGQPFIFVAVNYRIGGFGFLAGKEILQDGSANLGLLDQRMGLEWTADNIAAFGGDPTRVTIWGESSGGISVFSQMALYDGNATYKGQSLFRGAIMSSGSIVPLDPVDTHKAQVVFDTVAEAAGCHGGDKLQCLRDVDYDILLNATHSVPWITGYNSLALSYLPRPDGRVLTDSADVLARDGKFHAVPIIAGSQEDEGTLFAQVQTNLTDTDALVDYFSDIYFPHADRTLVTQMVEKYKPSPIYGSPFRTGLLYEKYTGFKRLAAILGDIVFNLMRREALDRITTAKPQVEAWSYLSSYLYDPFGVTGNDRGTFHGSLAFILFFEDLLPAKLPFPTNRITNYFVNFLYNLDPNKVKELPVHWPQWNESREMLHLNVLNSPIIVDDFRSDQAKFLKDHIDKLRI